VSAQGSRKVIFAALVGNAAIAISKLIAAAITGSSAMFSEGIHSIVDTGNQGLLLLGLKRARKAPDDRYPFGYGKEIYFWSFVVAIMIFGLGAGVSIYEGIGQLRHPHGIVNPALNYIILGFAFVFEGAAWLFAFKEFRRVKGASGYLEAVRKGKDPSVFVVLFEDSAAMIGIGIAFLGILLSQLTGTPEFDGIASLLIGLILAGTALWLAWETKGLLIGESADRAVVDGIRLVARRREGVVRVNEVLTLHMGPEYVLVNLSVDFKNEMSAGRLEEVIALLDAEIREAYPHVKRIFIEAEAQRPGSRGSPGKAARDGEHGGGHE
jgi:cation diffusion facilitator family transporter